VLLPTRSEGMGPLSESRQSAESLRGGTSPKGFFGKASLPGPEGHEVIPSGDGFAKVVLRT
jgi:hypothetical protein